MSRAHLTRVIQDAQGNLRMNAVVRVFDDATTTLTTEPLFAAESGTATVPNPYNVTTGIIDCWTAAPKRFRIGVKVGDEPEVLFEGVDALSPDTTAASTQPTFGTAVQPVGTTSSPGTSPDAVRVDHVHQSPGFGTNVQAVGTTSTPGVSPAMARVDHVHQGAAATGTAVGTASNPYPADGIHIADTNGVVWRVTVDITGHLNTQQP